MLPGNRKNRLRPGLREKSRKLDRGVGKVVVRKISDTTTSPQVVRKGGRKTRGFRKPPIKLVEDNQKDKDKEPIIVIDPITDIDKKTGNIPVPPDDIMDLEDDNEEDLPFFEPISVTINLKSWTEMQRQGIVNITETTRGDQSTENSVNDPRFGPYDPREVCEECNESECQGHYGLITFPEDYPVPNPIMTDFISQILNCVCNSCGKLLQTEEALESKGILRKTGYDRIKAIVERCKGISCSEKSKGISEREILELGEGSEKQQIKTGSHKICSTNPEFSSSNSKNNGWVSYKMSDKDKDYNMLDPKKVLDILDAISPEDANLLGFKAPSHPRDMVMQGILIFPTKARPPYKKGAEVNPDQLTDFFNRIVRSKKKLENSDNLGGKCECYKEMVSAVKDVMDSSNSPYQHKPCMPIRNRIQGKNGLYRRMMMGKRTDFCARTVLGPGGDIRFGQIRIPQKIADILPRRITVFEHNRKAVEEMIKQGKVLFIKQPHEKLFKKYIPGNDYPVRIGTVVDRKLENGDLVVFNRQPTLHKYSLMSYEVVIGKQYTTGLHLAVTPPHNADFDGDEGNLWALMSQMTISEGKYLMNVDKCIISSQTNRPTVGLVLDAVTGLYILTYFNTIFEPEEFENLLGNIVSNRQDLNTLSRRAVRHGVNPLSGRALFSALLPKDFNYEKKGIEIIDGILVKGNLSGGHIGTSHRSLIQELKKDFRYGTLRVVDFLTDASYLSKEFLNEYGFSVGIEDCNPNAEKIRNLMNEKIAETRIQYELLAGKEVSTEVEREYKENLIIALLQELSGLGAQIVKASYSEDNAVRIMASDIGGGAKGKTLNVTQIAALLGEQFIFGNRPKKQITGGTRTLCTFESGDTSMESRGCVLSSFSSGLKMSEFFFHAMSSRQGLMDTAVKTAEIGSIHHKMVKAVEGLSVSYDGSVRDHVNKIVQFTYGDDGFNAAEMISVPTNKSQNLATFIDLKMTVSKINVARGWAPRETVKTIREQRKEFVKSFIKKKFEK